MYNSIKHICWFQMLNNKECNCTCGSSGVNWTLVTQDSAVECCNSVHWYLSENTHLLCELPFPPDMLHNMRSTLLGLKSS